MTAYPRFCKSSNYPNIYSYTSPNNSSPPKPISPLRPWTPPLSTNYNESESTFSLYSNFTLLDVLFYEAKRTLKSRNTCTKREVILWFCILTWKYHLDKWSCNAPYTKGIYTEKFKHITNTRDLLLEKLRNSWFCAF